MSVRGFLGIDVGTQGLSVVFTDESLSVLATGEEAYGMVSGLDEGHYEQHPESWEAALQHAMDQLRARLDQPLEVLAIGISGQMHGEVLADEAGNSLCPARLWCDSRNEAEGAKLTQLLKVKMPKRITAARWLWTVRNQPAVAAKVRHLTTPAGWISFRLTGQWRLGIGDASGMFPIDPATMNYDTDRLERFDHLVAETGVAAPPLKELLPIVRRAGEDGGVLDPQGSACLQLPQGIPVAPAEGDQPAALAGSLIGDSGMVSMSFGTSVCANAVGDRPFSGVSHAVDHFCAVDGNPINMVCLRNGTTFMNALVEMFGQATGSSFETIMPQLLQASPNCGGLLALPFMDDEPALGIEQGGTAMLVGLAPGNATAGNATRAGLLATIFNLKLGSEVLDQQGFQRRLIVLSGGLTRTPELGQIVADVFRVPVQILAASDEGTAWGAALLAKFRKHCMDRPVDWSSFLKGQTHSIAEQFEPNSQAAAAYDEVYDRYQVLLQAHTSFTKHP